MTTNKLSKSDTLLLSHNINPALRGYVFIKYILENETVSSNTKLYDLYNNISHKFNTTPSIVQQRIKYAFKNSDFIKKTSKRNLVLLSHEYKIDLKEE